MTLRVAPALAALALAGAATGCGGSSGGEPADPETWATGFCQALTRFTDGISRSGSGLQGEGLPSGDDVVAAVREAADASGAFADEIRALGPPDVPGGDEIVGALTDAAGQAESAFHGIEDEVAGPIEGATDVAVRAGKIAEAAQTALTGIGEATNRLQELDVDGRLADAFAAAPACQDA